MIVKYVAWDDANVRFPEKAYILKSMFDMTEQELRENQAQLKQELEAVNQQQEQYWRSFIGR